MTTRADELRALVEDAWNATAALEDAAVDRGEAFRMVLEAALRENGGGAWQAAGETGDTGASPASSCDTAEARTSALAAALAIKHEQVADLFDVRSTEPALTTFAARQLARDCRLGMREITLLICVARNAVGLSTGTWLLRDLAGAYDRLDLKDFEAALESMEEIFVRGVAGDEDRGITLRSLGVEAAREIAQRMLA